MKTNTSRSGNQPQVRQRVNHAATLMLRLIISTSQHKPERAEARRLLVVLRGQR